MSDVIKIDSKAAAKRLQSDERVPIFEIDDVEYSVPKVTRADLGLNYIGRVIEVGDDVATAEFIVATMGEEAFQALRDVEGLDPDDWSAIMEKIQAVTNPKARTNRASRRA